MEIPQVVCDTAKVRFFKQITTTNESDWVEVGLFAILQKYDFSSKSQLSSAHIVFVARCLRYCKSTIFQANHNLKSLTCVLMMVVCDTAKVRFFKQITTKTLLDTKEGCCLRYCKSTIFQANHNPDKRIFFICSLFAILQKYDFSSKSQHCLNQKREGRSCLRYCKSTIFQANHNTRATPTTSLRVVCDTAKVRFFKQITTTFSSPRW